MLVIANNITTRNTKIGHEFEQLKTRGATSEFLKTTILREIAEQCVAAGADMLEIDIQQHHDRPEVMESAVKAVQQVTDCRLCLSTNNVEAVEAGLRTCKRPPLVNFVSIDVSRLKEMLPLIARHGAEVVLLVTDPAQPSDALEMVKRTAILAGSANEVGITNDHIIIDPGLFHIGSDMGQRHLVQVMEYLQALPDAVEPSVRSTCWLSNISAGASEGLRPILDTTLLAMLSGLGLSSVFLDVLHRENMRMVRLLRAFKNETVYADSDIEL
jgi:cobalamin-dependent methionine synthase I